MQWITDSINSLTAGMWGGGELKTTGMVPKETLLKFFELGAQMFDSPENKAYLKEQHAAGADVEDVITEMQKKVLEGLGVQGDHGIACLSKVMEAYQSDQAFMAKFSEFVNREAMAADEASLSPEEFAQNMAMTQQMQAKQAEYMRKMQSMGPEEQRQFMMQQMQAQAAMMGGHGSMGQVGTALSEAEQLQFLQNIAKGGQ